MHTLGSLFDGSGTFPFAAEQCGIKALWASEIEKFPIEVTTKRFPEMKHLGDITKINGADIEPVDVITFGSPCQDLSVAGKRAGLEGDRSGLFAQAIRIIKEMRSKTNGEYPKFAIWENVPGAFSSNNGEDFRTVLEELCKIKRSDTVIPRPECKAGKSVWRDAGAIMGNGFSIAWRVLDAQFWGVPQRRRRIFLVADFTGQCAGKVLFEREGLQRDFAKSRESWEGITANAESSTYVKSWDTRGNGDGDTCSTITGDHENRVTDYTSIVLTVDGYNSCLTNEKAATIGTNCGMSTGRNTVLCAELGAATRLGSHVNTDLCSTLRADMGDNLPIVCYALDRASFNQGINAKYDIGIDDSGISQTIVAKGPGAVCYAISSYDSNAMKSSNPHSGIYIADTSRTIDTNGGNPAMNQGGVMVLYPATLELRRLTPTECGRLQGMPDWWCADVPHSDSAEYKMWGNGMALPCVLYVMEGVAKQLEMYDKLKEGEE